MSVVSWQRIADDLTKQVRELQDKVAALEAELERLRCCGNCGRFVIDCDDLETYCPNSDGTFTRCYIQDHCHFTPSRWSRRGG